MALHEIFYALDLLGNFALEPPVFFALDLGPSLALNLVAVFVLDPLVHALLLALLPADDRRRPKVVLRRRSAPGIQLREPRVCQRLVCRAAHLGSHLQHLAQQLQAQAIDLRQDGAQLLRRVHGPRRLVLGESADARPGAFRGCAHQAEDLQQLVFVRCAREERPAGEHFCHDAPCTPDIDAGVVSAAAEQDVGCAVPEGDDFV